MGQTLGVRLVPNRSRAHIILHFDEGAIDAPGDLQGFLLQAGLIDKPSRRVGEPHHGDDGCAGGDRQNRKKAKQLPTPDRDLLRGWRRHQIQFGLPLKSPL